MIAGLGAGAGESFTGISITGLGAGAGERLSGLHIAGAGLGAPVVRGILLCGLAAGAEDFAGGVIAPAYFKIANGGRFRGVSISAYNRIEGRMSGVTIGLLNWAEHLNGLQIGVLNYARNQRSGLKLLPVLNYKRD
jgi:hypothetical protein